MPLRPFNRKQAWLMPPTLGDLVPEDHPVRFAAAFVDGLDAEAWEELEIDLQGDPRGAGAYHPRALLGVWIYGFMTGVRSCRKLEAACRDQLPYMWLVGMQQPDHNTLGFFTGTRTGEIQSRIANDVGGIQNVVTNTLSSVLSNTVIFLSTLVAMSLMSWQLTAVSVAAIPVFLIMSRIVGERRRQQPSLLSVHVSKRHPIRS